MAPGHRQLVGVRIWVPFPEYVQVEEAASANSFAVPLRSIASLRADCRRSAGRARRPAHPGYRQNRVLHCWFLANSAAKMAPPFFSRSGRTKSDALRSWANLLAPAAGTMI
jgi:hypothetical protein